MPDRSFLRFLLSAVALTLVIRGLAIWLDSDAFLADPDAYRVIAETLGRSGVFGLTGSDGVPRAIAFRPPLYPWLLSMCMPGGQWSPLGVAVLHLGLAGFASAFVFLSTRRLATTLCDGRNGNPERWGLVAAVLTAIDPILLRQSVEVMTETLAATLTSAAIWLWIVWQDDDAPAPAAASSRWVPLGLGATLAMAYLCRPTFLVWAVLLVIATVARFRDRRGLWSAAVIASLVAIAVGGWTWRNTRVLGHPVWATTHGGYTLLLANNDSFYRYLSEGRFGQAWDATSFLNAYAHRYEGDPRRAAFWHRDWDAAPNYDAAVSEVDDDRLCYESAVATIKRQPSMFVWSAVVRVARLWSPFPHDVSGRSKLAVAAVGVFYLTLFVAVIVAVVRHRRRMLGSRWWAIWLLAVTLTGVHAVYWSNMRMRAPMMPAIAIVAVFCVCKPIQTSPNSNTLR
ncbi:hypothetical protein Mal15_49300 [Stieleria maiorica]|uniref:Glycosyltransferase RgtA/B/C/D-like domain-containing protein n=1 Tax=Stieleria maiorica TaxID=2795974 RepID=A0A5B9MIW0_9BACT|nr:hypothetical protein [Stieleria maiorica]QEG00854.1 hypothetical protein Mal15_49300 [Stieleria maiorica]